MTARRFYLGRSTSPPTSSNTATIDPFWNDVVPEAPTSNSSTANRAPSNGAMAGELASYNSSNDGQTQIGQMCWRFITEPLAPGVLAGTLRLVVRAAHQGTSLPDRSTRLALVVNVHSADGTVRRGTVFSGLSANTLGTTTSLPPTATIAGALTPLDVTTGDRLHIELGFYTTRTNPTGGSASGAIRLGDPTALADLEFGEGVTVDGRPWIEFTSDPFAVRPSVSTLQLAQLDQVRPRSVQLAVPALGAVDLAGAEHQLVVVEQPPEPEPIRWVHRVDVTLGARAFTIDPTTPPDFDADLWVLDGLGIGWTMPEGPSVEQPDPVTANIELVVPHAQVLPELDLGTPLSLRCYVLQLQGDVQLGAPLLVGTFDGRVADLGAEPCRVPHPELPARRGLRLSLLGVDYTADYSELEVGATPWPAEAAQQRVLHILDAHPATEQFVPVNYGRLDTTAELHARDVDNQPLRQLIVDTVAQQPNLQGQRVILAPYVDQPTTGAWTPGFDPIGGDYAATADELPATLALVGGDVVLQLDDPDDATAWVLPASAIDGNVRWFRNKRVDVNAVDVSGTFDGSEDQTTVSVDNGQPQRVAHRVDVQLTESAAARRLADYLLPDVPAATGWSIDQLLLHGKLAPTMLAPAFLPDHQAQGFDADAARAGCYQRPVVVSGLAVSMNPDGRSWVAGQLRSARLELRRGRYTVQLQLRRSLARPAPWSTGALTFADLQAGQLSTKPISALPPSVPFYDLRLVRGSS